MKKEKNINLTEQIFKYLLERSFLSKKLYSEFFSLNKEQHIELLDNLAAISNHLGITYNLKCIRRQVDKYYDPRLLLLSIQLIVHKQHIIDNLPKPKI